MKRKIAVFTGTRAEYGLLYWVLKRIQANPALELQLIVSGAHLSEKFGDSGKQIKADGFDIAAKVDMHFSDDTPRAITASMAHALRGCADALAELKPHILLVLGDRYEAFAAATAAMMARVPIAHMHGGELTLGAIDDAIRHAITKMAHLHFVAAEPFRARVLQMGENPERVWVTGAPCLDAIEHAQYLSKAELGQRLGIALRPPVYLVTFHPQTLHAERSVEFYRNMLQALATTTGTIIITGSNADQGHDALRDMTTEFCAAHAERCLYRENLGSPLYLIVMKHSDVVVGNSSSALLEAPALGTPSIDIGTRQQGRPRAASVIHAEGSLASIEAALKQAVSPEHKQLAALRTTPYGTHGAAAKVEQILAEIPLENLLHKTFVDL